MKKHWNIISIEELKDYILNHSSYFKKKCCWNLDNKIFLEKVLSKIPKESLTITSLDKIIKGIPLKLSSLKRASNISLEYWKAIGWEDNEEIKNRISNIQKTNSKSCIEYWIKKGFNKEDAIKNVSDYQIRSSKIAWQDENKMKINNPIFKEYWIKNGLTLEEALRKINPSNREYYGYKNEEDYKKHNVKNSNNIKKSWKNGTYDNLRSLYDSRYISKEEILFFNYLEENKIHTDIKHIPFGINVRNSEKLNKYFVVADGYLKIDEGIILIEYDGTYYHTLDVTYDDIRDEEIFKIRPDIIGIIRFTDNYFKRNKKNVIKIKTNLEDGISKIKSKKYQKIRYN